MKIKKNGKVINLTESDLKRITKLVMTEEKTDNNSDFAECFKNLGINPPESCQYEQYKECVQDVGKMLVENPLDFAPKVVTILNCLKDKHDLQGVMNF